MDQRGGAPDLQDVDGLAGLDDQRLVVGLGAPDLAGQLDPPRVHGGDPFGDQPLLADQLAVTECQVGTRLHALDDVGTDQQGLVTERITAMDPGRIKLAGEIWSAQPYDETLVIEPGETVDILQIKGATALVHPVPRLEH